MPRTSRAAYLRVVVTLAAVLALTAAPLAGASVLDDDLVGGIAVAESSDRAQVAPDIAVPAGFLGTFDGEVLWSRDADDERAMASTTKIMTAVVVLDSVEDLDEVVTVTAEAVKVGESGVGIKAGERHTVRDLLAAMLVHSANEAATALAIHVGGSVDGFVSMMNEKAASLSLTHTHFTNPHGLDEEGHYTSASDLATLAVYAMHDPVFREWVSAESVLIPGPGGTRKIEASNKMLGSYDGAHGVKTGWTNDAGYCVVASAERDGIELVAVVLGADDEDERFEEAASLLDWGFSHYALQTVSSADETATLVPVTDYLDVTVVALVSTTTVVPVFDLDGDVTASVDVLSEVEAPVSVGDRLGTLNIRQGQRLLAQVPLVAAANVQEPGGWERIGIWFTRLWRGIFGGQRQAEPVSVM